MSSPSEEDSSNYCDPEQVLTTRATEIPRSVGSMRHSMKKAGEVRELRRIEQRQETYTYEDCAMTTYHRRGHFRRGPNGQLVWVTGHMVSRSSRHAYAPRFYAPAPKQTAPSAAAKRVYPAGFAQTTRLPRSVRLLRPNAVCPVCGAFVYFYANEFGSRVYFDEIGPPWPKHPCTDNAHFHGSKVAGVSGRTAPALYSPEVGRRKMASSGPPLGTMKNAFVVQASWQNDYGTIMQLQRLYQKSAFEVWVTPEYVTLAVGQLVFVDNGSLSYIDAEKIAVVRIPVHVQEQPRKVSFLQRLRGMLNL